MTRIVFFGALALVILVLSWDAATLFLQQSLLTIFYVDASGLFAKLKNELTGFYALFLVTFYFDVIKQKDSIKVNSNEINSIRSMIMELKSLANVDLAIKGHLSRMYGENISSLIGILTPIKKVYKDCVINIKMKEDSVDSGYFFYNQIVEFHVESKEVIVAVTNSIAVQDALFSISEIDEVFCDTNAVMSEAHCERFKSEIKCTYVYQNDEGASPARKIVGEKLSKRQMNNIVKKIPHDMREHVYFIKYTADADATSVEFRIQYPPARFKKTIPFVYWMCDRVMFVKKIEIDSEYFCSRKMNRITIMPFISNYSSPNRLNDLDHDSMPIVLNVESWMTYGQGIIIAWREQS